MKLIRWIFRSLSLSLQNYSVLICGNVALHLSFRNVGIGMLFVAVRFYETFI